MPTREYKTMKKNFQVSSLAKTLSESQLYSILSLERTTKMTMNWKSQQQKKQRLESC
jgi:hypothetical protein